MEWITHDGWFELHTANHGFISLEPRPSYCDRGRRVANDFLNLNNPHGTADAWRRYYMDMSRAKAVLGAYVTMRIAKDR